MSLHKEEETVNNNNTEEEEPFVDMFQIDSSYYKKPKPTRIEKFTIENTDFEVNVSLIGNFNIIFGIVFNHLLIILY